MKVAKIVYHCPYCKMPIVIIGDPSPPKKLLAHYLVKKPTCNHCGQAL